MDEAEVRRTVEAERLSLCDTLDALDPEQWRAPSLCSGWTVLEVVAHLTAPTRTSLPAMSWGMALARGDFDRMADRDARRRAERSSADQLVAQLRETAGSARRMPGSSPMDPLVDVLVHGQDICRPLGLARPVPVAAAHLALAHVSTSVFHGAPGRLEALRLVASDSGWNCGSDDRPEVRGATGDLLLVATGRAVGVEALDGPGVPVLRTRLSGGGRLVGGPGDGRR